MYPVLSNRSERLRCASCKVAVMSRLRELNANLFCCVQCKPRNTKFNHNPSSSLGVDNSNGLKYRHRSEGL
jgi:hypothetical protein